MNVFAFASLVLGFAGAGQAHNTPPEDSMSNLAFIVGDWKGKQTFMTDNGGTMVGDASDHAEWAVGKRFIEEHLSTTLGERPPTDTRHMLAYDKRSGQYVAYWFNDTAPLPMVLTGKLDGAKLVLTTTSSTGAHNQLRFTYDGSKVGELSLTFEMETSNVWQELFRTVYTK